MEKILAENETLTAMLRDECMGHPDACSCRSCRKVFRLDKSIDAAMKEGGPPCQNDTENALNYRMDQWHARECERLRAESEALKADLEKCHDNACDIANKADDALDNLRTENEKLRKELESIQANLCSLQICFNDWKVVHSTTRLEIENERLRAENERLTKSNDHQYKVNGSLLRDLDRMHNIEEGLRDKNADLYNENAKVHEKVFNLREWNEKLRAEIKALRSSNDLTKAVRWNHELLHELDRARTENEALRGLLAPCSTQLAALAMRIGHPSPQRDICDKLRSAIDSAIKGA